MVHKTRFGCSWLSGSSFGRTERRLRGNIQIQESSSSNATVNSQPQHHHYFGNEHSPSYIHMKTTSDVQPKKAHETENSNESKDNTLLSLPRSSIATLNPRQHFADTVISVDVTLPTSVVADRKKKMKTKKAQLESAPPSVGPDGSTKVSTYGPNMAPIPRQPSGASSHLSLAPSLSPSTQMEAGNATIDPPFASESLSKEERATAGVVTTSAILVLALIIFAVSKRSKKRHKNVSKLNITDPALCENASVSSERSSTFRDDDEKRAKDLSCKSSITSKVNHQELKSIPVSSNARRQNGVAMHLMKLINASIDFSKKNHAHIQDSRNDETEIFPSLSPYLVDEFSSTGTRTPSETALMLEKSTEQIVSAEPVRSLAYLENDGETLLEESDRLAWRAALDLDFNYNSNLYNDKLSNDRRPWRSHMYATVVANDDNRSSSQPLTLPSSNTGSARGCVTKQKSLDEMSMGSVDFINPEIVEQFKVVDQRLSEGFEQFRAVDQRLSDEFDKLEATLVKNGHAKQNNTSNFMVEENKKGENITGKSTPLTLTEFESPSCTNPTSKISQFPPHYDCHDTSSTNDESDDDDDFQRRYRLPQLRSYFSHNMQPQSRALAAMTASSPMIDSTLSDQSLVEEGMTLHHNYTIPSNPISLLNMPKSSKSDVRSSIRNSNGEVETDDEDILSTTNDDIDNENTDDDEYCFHKIRSRFDNINKRKT